MASKNGRSNTATMLHSIAEELGCAPELVGVVKKELKLRSRKDILHATQERIAQMAAQDEPAKPVDDNATTDTPKPKKERKAGLTLSQRRALLILLDNDSVQPVSGFKSLPYEHLVEVGYADRTILDDAGDDVTNDAGIGVYTLTPKGRERAESINPGYRVWASGETVAGDESRPVAGTHRATKAEQEAAKAAAEAAAADEEVDGDDREADDDSETAAEIEPAVA